MNTASPRSPTWRPPAALPADSLALALHGAAHVVAAVAAGRNLTLVLGELGTHAPDLAVSQRAAVQDLAYGTLRDYGYGDRCLAPLLRDAPSDPIHSLLRVAVHRLQSRPEAAHTIVDQAVDAAAQMLGGRLRGLANGVLRNYLRRREDLCRAAEQDPVARHRHPEWWIHRLRHDRPRDWAEILAAGNDHPPMALRANPRRIDPADLLRHLDAAGIPATRIGPSGLALAAPIPVARIPGFERGECSVQDPGAQEAAHWLDLRPGQRVLDACAAPGGKTAHILELCDVELTALDLLPERLAKVRQNLARLGLDARLQAADCIATDLWWDGRPFDRILADVPCSASGVVRRHPDIKWLRRDADIPAFAAQQSAILDRLWHTLAPGGKMLYATCSVFADENERQAARFRELHADARSLPLEGAPDRQLLPCPQHDGFFYALFEKAR